MSDALAAPCGCVCESGRQLFVCDDHRRAALTVACDYCGRSAGYPCQRFDRLIGCWWGERKPHAARVRAAEREERGKEKGNGQR